MKNSQNDKTIIERINEQMFREFKETRRPLRIVLTQYDKEMLEKEKNYKLKKYTTSGLVAIGLLAAVATFTIPDKKVKLVDATGIENNLNEEEMKIISQLEQYSLAAEEYENIAKDKNYSEQEKFNKRIELIAQIRELTNTANFLMEEKVKKALELDRTNIDISIYKEKNSEAGPTDCISVKQNNQVLFTTTNTPAEFRDMLNKIDIIESYEGSGENKVWETAIYDFKNDGNNLYNAIVDLTEKDFYYENGTIQVQQTKNK